MPVLDVSSHDYESWMAGLAANQGPARQRIIKAFASVLGDKAVEWMTWANLEHLPSYASDQSIALIASERQLDTAAGEAASSIALRAPFWLQLGRFSGTGLGILLGLHFSGFDGATLIQQNGRALSLALPLPAFVLGQTWDPTPNLVVTSCNPLVTSLTSSVTPGRSIPAGTPWFAFDGNTDFCSRFTVLFPGPLPSQFMTVGVATFTASDTASVVWNNAFADTTYHVQPGIPTITDGGGGVSVVADLTIEDDDGGAAAGERRIHRHRQRARVADRRQPVCGPASVGPVAIEGHAAEVEAGEGDVHRRDRPRRRRAVGLPVRADMGW
jgi:hypothetical protein